MKNPRVMFEITKHGVTKKQALCLIFCDFIIGEIPLGSPARPLDGREQAGLPAEVSECEARLNDRASKSRNEWRDSRWGHLVRFPQEVPPTLLCCRLGLNTVPE